jgi:hypothetical protein
MPRQIIGILKRFNLFLAKPQANISAILIRRQHLKFHMQRPMVCAIAIGSVSNISSSLPDPDYPDRRMMAAIPLPGADGPKWNCKLAHSSAEAALPPFPS